MKRIIGIVAWVLVMAISVAVQAQTIYEVKSHSLVIEGTSNLHDWTADVQNVKGTFNIKVEDKKIVGIEKLSVKVDAQSLKGSKGSIMDSKINDALNSKKYPEISFDLQKVNSIKEEQGSIRLNTIGVLKISGVTKTVNLTAIGRITPNGEVEFTGTTKLKMSDFNVSPPRAMFGALTTGDEVDLKYSVVLKPNLLSDNK